MDVFGPAVASLRWQATGCTGGEGPCVDAYQQDLVAERLLADVAEDVVARGLRWNEPRSPGAVGRGQAAARMDAAARGSI